MKQQLSKALVPLTFIFCLMVIFLLSQKSTAMDSPLELIAPLYKEYFEEKADLYRQYQKANDKEKAIIKQKRKEQSIAFQNHLDGLDVIGKSLSFEVIDKLDFTVQDVLITSVDSGSMEFVIQTKLNKDLRKETGELLQRMKVYFFAFDKKNKKIPRTGNWATNHGWIPLSKDTQYAAQGHWNTNRLQNMAEFGSIKIMSEESYKAIKKM